MPKHLQSIQWSARFIFKFEPLDPDYCKVFVPRNLEITKRGDEIADVAVLANEFALLVMIEDPTFTAFFPKALWNWFDRNIEPIYADQARWLREAKQREKLEAAAHDFAALVVDGITKPRRTALPKPKRNLRRRFRKLIKRYADQLPDE